ncbi:MAG: hypothetical protein M1822_007803 [Bathelium mastoideum]|nr:MAG: hypothetical protein M1822_007803 [Bathelium mastoideum]
MASAKYPQVQESQLRESYAPTAHHVPKDVEGGEDSPSRSSAGNGAQQHGTPEFTAIGLHPGADATVEMEGERRGFWKREWFGYVKTKEFWIVLVLGQILSLALTGENTLSSLLAQNGTSLPAFQTLLNYALMNLVFSPYTIYRYGWRKYVFELLLRDGWRYFILAFVDVEGNYFTVLAYRYTTILSAELINFWAIVVVVLISFTLMKVRYRPTQLLGILVCVGGMGLLIASDHITGANGGYAPDQLKGDLFALLGASFYGLSNVYDEYLVSKRPFYEVIGQMGFWGMLINGVQSAIFDRPSYRTAVWDRTTGGYLAGFTILLFLFYILAPLTFRLSSAAFFNISLLTANFWGLIIGLKLFGLSVHWMYPLAFCLIIVGLVIYFVMEGTMGEAKKPWLGEDQERGVDGFATARRKIEQARGSNGHV